MSYFFRLCFLCSQQLQVQSSANLKLNKNSNALSLNTKMFRHPKRIKMRIKTKTTNKIEQKKVQLIFLLLCHSPSSAQSAAQFLHHYKFVWFPNAKKYPSQFLNNKQLNRTTNHSTVYFGRLWLLYTDVTHWINCVASYIWVFASNKNEKIVDSLFAAIGFLILKKYLGLELIIWSFTRLDISVENLLQYEHTTHIRLTLNDFCFSFAKIAIFDLISRRFFSLLNSLVPFLNNVFVGLQ